MMRCGRSVVLDQITLTAYIGFREHTDANFLARFLRHYHGILTQFGSSKLNGMLLTLSQLLE